MSIKTKIPVIPLRACEVCGAQYQPVRQKQRFCSQSCHNRFHNSLRLQKEVKFGNVYKILEKNRNILWELWEKGKRQIALTELQKLGFQSEYITHFSSVQKTNFVLDMAYKAIGGTIEILKPNKQA
jgi:predicted nucleic acid-binding Zn ribbon protein